MDDLYDWLGRYHSDLLAQYVIYQSQAQAGGYCVAELAHWLLWFHRDVYYCWRGTRMVIVKEASHA